MMPTAATYGGWPNSGEIDIMEEVGYEPNRISGSLHCLNHYFSNH
jgi:beta-glucanase (GH16 family)